MRARILKILFGLLVISSFISCDPNTIFEHNFKIDKSNWNRDSLIDFQFNIEDTAAIYELYINFRHAGNYPYRNLYLFAHFSDPDGRTATDTAQMLLADNRGVWMGKGIGSIYDYQFKFKEGNLFPAQGEYKIKLEQAMRDKVLTDVTDIGIGLKKRIDKH